jgi:hypothetical protein
MSNDAARFSGFDNPQQNWSKLPHAMIDALPQITCLSEMKVILYILRHTWGYQEFDTYKRITLDEFENGRKRKDGERLDNGIGMSGPSIISGLKRAVEHGFIEVEVDDSDPARVKKFYMIRQAPKQGLKSLTPGVKEFNPRGKEPLHRTEKDTVERNHEKEGRDAPAPDSPTLKEPSPRSVSDVLFPDGERPPSSHPLATEAGRDALFERSQAALRERAGNKPHLDLEDACPTIAKYRPPAGVDRDAVLRFVRAMIDAHVPLDYQSKGEVRYWLKETEGLMRKAGGDEAVALAALQKALRDGVSLKSPRSVHYAVSDVLRARNREYAVDPSVGVVTPVRKISVPRDLTASGEDRD